MAAGKVTRVTLDHVTDGQSILAGVTGRRPEVLAYLLTADGTGRVKILSGSTVLVAVEVVAGGGAVICPPAFPEDAWMLQGASGEALSLVTTGSVNVSGHVLCKQTPITPGS